MVTPACGGAYFLLQEVHAPEWQANQVLVLEVDDLVTGGRR